MSLSMPPGSNIVQNKNKYQIPQILKTKKKKTNIIKWKQSK